MSRWWPIVAVFVVVVAAAACSKGDGESARDRSEGKASAIDARRGPTGTELAAVARQHVDLLEQLAAAADATQGNCDAMAGRLEAIVASNRAFYDRLAALIEDDEAAKKLDSLATALRDRSEAAMRKLEPALTPCMADAKLSELMDSILL